MSKSKVTLCRNKFLFSGPSPVSGNPIEATTGRQGQKPGHPARGSEPTSPEVLPPTAWTAATSCLRQEPHLSQTMSSAIGEPHTHLRSLLPDSILTKWEEPLPPPYRLPATSVALPTFTAHIRGSCSPRRPEFILRAQPGHQCSPGHRHRRATPTRLKRNPFPSSPG